MIGGLALILAPVVAHLYYLRLCTLLVFLSESVSCSIESDSLLLDCRLPSSFVHGIVQAQILEWVAISFSRGLPDPGIEPRSPTLQEDSLPSEPPGNPCEIKMLYEISCFLLAPIEYKIH